MGTSRTDNFFTSTQQRHFVRTLAAERENKFKAHSLINLDVALINVVLNRRNATQCSMKIDHPLSCLSTWYHPFHLHKVTMKSPKCVTPQIPSEPAPKLSPAHCPRRKKCPRVAQNNNPDSWALSKGKGPGHDRSRARAARARAARAPAQRAWPARDKQRALLKITRHCSMILSFSSSDCIIVQRYSQETHKCSSSQTTSKPEFRLTSCLCFSNISQFVCFRFSRFGQVLPCIFDGVLDCFQIMGLIFVAVFLNVCSRTTLHASQTFFAFLFSAVPIFPHFYTGFLYIQNPLKPWKQSAYIAVHVFFGCRPPISKYLEHAWESQNFWWIQIVAVSLYSDKYSKFLLSISCDSTYDQQPDYAMCTCLLEVSSNNYISSHSFLSLADRHHDW